MEASVPRPLRSRRARHGHLEVKDKPPRRGHNASDKMIGTLDVERPAIALELGRKQHGVRLVDLLRGIATSSTSPPNACVGPCQFIKGRLQLRMEDTRAVASWMGGQELLRREILTVDEVLDIVDDVSADSLQRVAKELWQPSAFRYSSSVVSNATRCTPAEWPTRNI